jgi:hypothetical protein
MRRSPAERRAARAAGVDRHGHPLPRVVGANPRALRAAERGQSSAAPSGSPRSTGGTDRVSTDGLAKPVRPRATRPATAAAPRDPQDGVVGDGGAATGPLPPLGDGRLAPQGATLA